MPTRSQASRASRCVAGLDIADDAVHGRLFSRPALKDSRARGWARQSVVLEDQAYLDVSDITHAHHVVTMALSPVANTRVLDGRQHDEDIRPGQVCITPSGVALSSRCETRTIYLNVLIDPETAREASARQRHAPMVRGLLMTGQDPGLSRLMHAVLGALKDDSTLSDLRAEALGQALAVHLLQHHSDSAPAETRRNHGLTPHQMKPIEDYVGDRIGEDLTVRMLADELAMSLPHFSRQFRAATGFSPWQYILRFRLEEARRNVLRTPLPLSHVAADLGFSDEAHLCHAFRNHFGVTPGSLRNGRPVSA